MPGQVPGATPSGVWVSTLRTLVRLARNRHKAVKYTPRRGRWDEVKLYALGYMQVGERGWTGAGGSSAVRGVVAFVHMSCDSMAAMDMAVGLHPCNKCRAARTLHLHWAAVQ